MTSSHRARDGSYLELYDGQHTRDYELGMVKTEIQGAVNDRRTHEEGGVRKSVLIHQSTTPARPAA